MAINRLDKNCPFEVECDNCPHSVEIDEEEWMDMIQELKDEGWLIRKVVNDKGEHWVHLCPDCKSQGVSAEDCV